MGTKLLPIAVVLVMVTGAAGADKGTSSPDPDLLEFLGTFETSKGKEIDPLLLENVPGKPAKQGKGEPSRPIARKPVQKDTPPKGREKDDE